MKYVKIIRMIIVTFLILNDSNFENSDQQFYSLRA